MKDVHGECVGVRFVRRGPSDPHICLCLLIEDDEIWHETDFEVSSYWIDDMIDTLVRAKARLRRVATTSPDGYGWIF